MEITQKERGAIYLVRAVANADQLTVMQRLIVLLTGSEYEIETENGPYLLRKFFGKLYYIR